MNAITLMKAGDPVPLVPTQGAYQKPLAGRVVRVTKTLLLVRVPGERADRQFCLDGQPYGARGREFPCYVVKPTQGVAS